MEPVSENWPVFPCAREKKNCINLKSYIINVRNASMHIILNAKTRYGNGRKFLTLFN